MVAFICNVALFLSFIFCPFLAISDWSLLLWPILSSSSFSLCPNCSILKKPAFLGPPIARTETQFVTWFGICISFQLCLTPHVSNQILNYFRKQKVTSSPVYSSWRIIHFCIHKGHILLYAQSTCLRNIQPASKGGWVMMEAVGPLTLCHLFFCPYMGLFRFQLWLFSLPLWSHTYPSSSLRGSMTSIWSAPSVALQAPDSWVLWVTVLP